MPATTDLFARTLPHTKTMLMLSNILQQDERTIHCTSIIETQNPLLVDGCFPALGGLELLAQASGVLLGFDKSGQSPRPGVIARIKALQLFETPIPVDAEVHIHASFTAGNLDAAFVEGRVLHNEQLFCRGSLMLATLSDTVL